MRDPSENRFRLFLELLFSRVVFAKACSLVAAASCKFVSSRHMFPRPIKASTTKRGRWHDGWGQISLYGLMAVFPIVFWQVDTAGYLSGMFGGSLAIIALLRLRGGHHALQIYRAQLAEAQEDLQSFSSLLPLFLWRATPDGRADFISIRYEEITGEMVSDALAHEGWRKTVHMDDLPDLDRQWLASIRTGQEFRQLFRLRQQDGSYRWMSGQARPLLDPKKGLPRRWYGGVFDVDAEIRATEAFHRLATKVDNQERVKQLEESKERFRVLFDDMNIAYAEQDVREAKKMIEEIKRNGVSDFRKYAAENPDFIDRCLAAIKVNQVNAALLNLMGYEDHQELVMKPPTENAVDSRRVMVEQLEAMFDDRHHFTTTATLLGKDNRRVTVAVGVNVANDWSMSLSTHIDITERLRTQELLASSREDLARANRSVTIGAVSTSLAHELNQPLLALNVAAQTARRWLLRSSPSFPDALRALERVSVNAERMNNIMKATREKLVRRTAHLGYIDLCALLVETEKLIEPELRRRNVVFKVSCVSEAAVAYAEPIELQQVVINLVMNAADAMINVSGEKLVTVSVQRSGGDEVKIDVLDNGTGIPEASLPHIFESFFTTKSGGMGMGLRICQTIIEGFNGSIEASNRPEGGARVSFSLPVSAPPDET